MSDLQSALTYGFSVFVGVLIFNYFLDPLISNKIINYLALIVFLFLFILVVHTLVEKAVTKTKS